MGVTIHFEGRLRDQTAFHDLMETGKSFAQDQGWRTQTIESTNARLLRVRDEKNWDYVGPVRGIALYPDVDCDPVRLEFDRDLYLQEFTKTQFAGVRIHLSVLEFLKRIEPYFEELKVKDEGEYWETGNTQLSAEHFSRSQEVIESELRKTQSARMKVKTPDGRIMDLYG
jgi:aminoglycoside N3'-acetyltransferase